MKVFSIDGVEYDVDVVSLSRAFDILDIGGNERTQDGELYREIVGTYYNYSMTIWPKIGKDKALDALWDVLSQPKESHVCVFPYNQKTLTQRMYVTKGAQQLMRKDKDGAVWGAITIEFIAMAPKVVAWPS